MRSVKILGRNIPLWLAATTVVMAIIIGVVTAIVVPPAGIIRMPWQVSGSEVIMEPREVKLEIGRLSPGQWKIAESSKLAKLTVKGEPVLLTIWLVGDYHGLSHLTVMVELRQYGIPKHVGIVSIEKPADSMLNVEPGIYDVYIGYLAKAGYIDSSGEAIVEIINGPCREEQICILGFPNATKTVTTVATRISPTTTRTTTTTETITVITIATVASP
jgi:hypothetical protein